MSIQAVEEFFAERNISITRRDLTEKDVGSTGYIDSINLETFPNGVHYGVDPHKRVYVTVKVRQVYHDEESAEYSGNEMITAFQRYSDDDKLWVMNRLGNADSLRNVLMLFVDKILTPITHDDEYSPYHFNVL